MDTQKNQKTNRREFIKMGLLSFAGVIMLPSCLKNYTPFRFFTIDEATLLAEICEEIIPADENGPGAKQAGVIYYIDKQLSEVFIHQQDLYRNGLVAMNESCTQIYSSSFENLERESRVLFLNKMENDGITGEFWQQNSASSFFSLIIRHTMQGFYGPPRHGGNKNYISYKMMNLDYPYVVGQNRYRNNPVYVK
jgi:gluconate 2-dehydrogenase gamma chain